MKPSPVRHPMHKRVAGYFSEQYAKHHSLLAVVAVLFGFGVFATAYWRYTLSEPYSWFTHFVSSLGWGPNGADVVFSAGLVILGLMMSPFALHLFQMERQYALPEKKNVTKALTAWGMACFVMALSGLVSLAVFGDIRKPSFFMHVIGAGMYFSMILNSILLFTWAAVINRQFSGFRIGVTLLVLLMYGGFFWSVAQLSGKADIGIGQELLETRLMFDMTADRRLEIVETMSRLSPWMGFFEWMVVLTQLIWFLAAAHDNHQRVQKKSVQ